MTLSNPGGDTGTTDAAAAWLVDEFGGVVATGNDLDPPPDPAAFAPGVGEAAMPLKLPPFGDWIGELVPANPQKAAVDGTMLPLVVFTVLLALALTRVSEGGRRPTTATPQRTAASP